MWEAAAKVQIYSKYYMKLPPGYMYISVNAYVHEFGV